MADAVVLDAGVLVNLFVPQPTSDACIAFINSCNAQPNFACFAPDCIFYEVAAVLRKYERLGHYPTLSEDLQRLYDLPIIAVSCKDLMQTAANISREHLISAYDAFYLALSRHQGSALVTTDLRLVNGTQGKGFDVQFVGNVSV